MTFFHEHIYILFFLFSLKPLAGRTLRGFKNTWSTACIINQLSLIFITVCFAFYFLAFHFSLILHWNHIFHEYLLVPWSCTYHGLCDGVAHKLCACIKWLSMGNQLKLKHMLPFKELPLLGNKYRVPGWRSNKKGLISFNNSNFV